MNKIRKQTLFVCSALHDNNLISEIIIANNQEDAVQLFKNNFTITPSKILGPFYKKRVEPVKIDKNIQFSGQIRSGIYNGWKVNAFLLKEPQDYAFLVFIKSLDNSPAPKNTTIIPIKDLRTE